MLKALKSSGNTTWQILTQMTSSLHPGIQYFVQSTQRTRQRAQHYHVQI